MYRIKQFLWAVLSIFQPIDYEFLDRYLIKSEKDIFEKLSKNEKHHCIRVCKDSLKRANDYSFIIDKNKLAKAALLHDVGKINTRLNVIDKSVIVLLDKFTNGKIKKFDNIKKIDTYYNHPQIGVKILEESKCLDKEILKVVEEHHYDKRTPGESIILDIIVECDNKN